MNKIRFAVPVIAGFLYCVVSLHANPANSNDILASMEARSSWRMDIVPLNNPVEIPQMSAEGNDPATKRSRRPKSITMIKYDQYMRRTTQWDDGSKTDRWWVGPYCFVKEPHSDFVFIIMWEAGVPEAVRPQFNPVDFPELAWVEPSTLIGSKDSPDTPLILYGLGKQNLLLEEADASYKVMLESVRQAGHPVPEEVLAPMPGSSRKEYSKLAWVDVGSKRPVIFEGDGMRWTYHFDEQPPEAPNFPAAYKQALVDYLEAANVQEGNEMVMPKRR